MARSMLVVDTVYPRALNAILSQGSGASSDYASALRKLLDAKFGMSDVYETFFANHGWDCNTVIANSTALQTLWAKENLPQWSLEVSMAKQCVLRRIPFFRNHNLAQPLLTKILTAQIDAFKPDILFCFDLATMSDEIIQEARRVGSRIVGQTNSPLPHDDFLLRFDLLISSLPFFIHHFTQLGIHNLHLDLGFDERVASRPAQEGRDIQVSFVGGLTRMHERVPLLRSLLEVTPSAAFYGYVDDEVNLPRSVQARHGGERWGLSAYEILANSAVTINEHGVIDPDLRFGGVRVAANMRLFEATGCGALLVTDHLPRIEEFFDVGSEILTYRNLNELKDAVRWALDNPSEAAEMAERAQRRTLQQHSYGVRLRTLKEALDSEFGAG